MRVSHDCHRIWRARNTTNNIEVLQAEEESVPLQLMAGDSKILEIQELDC
jgi:hypothetical protein